MNAIAMPTRLGTTTVTASRATDTKTRAKSAKKTEPTPTAQQPTLESVRASIATAVTTLEGGVLRGSNCNGAMSALVWTAVNEKLPKAIRPLDRVPLCVDDIWETRGELLPVLHLLDGAIALAPGEAGGIFEHQLVTARAAINFAYELVDCTGPIALSFPDMEGEARDFMDGKALLAAMFERALASETGGSSSMFAAYRSDTEVVEQVDFVKADLLRLANDPRLIDGYSAALCEMLSEATLDGATPQSIAAATYEECRGDPKVIAPPPTRDSVAALLYRAYEIERESATDAGCDALWLLDMAASQIGEAELTDEELSLAAHRAMALIRSIKQMPSPTATAEGRALIDEAFSDLYSLLGVEA